MGEGSDIYVQQSDHIQLYNWLCLPGMRENGNIHVCFLVSHLTHFMLFTLLPTLRFVAGIYTRLPGRPALAELKGHLSIYLIMG